MVSTALKLIGVGLVVIALGVLSYGQGHSDFSIFIIPSLGFVVNAWIAVRAMPTGWKEEAKLLGAFAAAGLLSFVELFALMFIALNTYGS